MKDVIRTVNFYLLMRWLFILGLTYEFLPQLHELVNAVILRVNP